MSDKDKPPDEWISSKEVARRIFSHLSTREKMRCQGRGPAFARIGRKVVLNWPVVKAWMQANGKPV